MKISTWNINSVRLRISQVERFLKQENPDVLCLQEIKCVNDLFPGEAIQALGYEHIAINGQKGYHGVAIASRLPLENVTIREFCGKGDTRHIAATVNGVRIHNFYVPAGGDEPDPEANEKFAHKLNFLDEMADWFANGVHQERMMLVGDLNIAPKPSDVWSHKQLLNVVSHTPVEVERLEGVQSSLGWVDVVRELTPEPAPVFTWWSYRARDWRASNRGRRLDHIWVTPALRDAALGAGEAGVHEAARGWEKPSDHAPVSARLAGL